MGALPLNARVAHFRLIFWRRESGITRVRAGKVDWLRRVWTQRSHVHSVGLEVEDLSAGVMGSGDTHIVVVASFPTPPAASQGPRSRSRAEVTRQSLRSNAGTLLEHIF